MHQERSALNVLMVVHQFLPRHLAGSELYTYHLARALRARGHRVTLFFTEIRPERPQYELTRGEFEGIPYFEAVHNRYFASFRHSYADPQMEKNFRTVLDQTVPDLVHLQHLYLHSVGYIEIARRRGLPVIYTLHEYMLMCLNRGLLLRPGSTLCEGPEPEACARCAAMMYPPPVPGQPRSGIEPIRRSFLPISVSHIAAKIQDSLESACKRWVPGFTRNADVFVDAVRLRRLETQAQLDQVNMFIAPSRFLRQRFLDEEIVTPERILHSDYGFVFNAVPKVRTDRFQVLRVGYVGTIAEFKGVHLIVDAFRNIHDAGIECRIYGDLDTFPDYTGRLLGGGVPSGIRFMGRLENEKIPATLADLDLLIVPSMWFENSPLTIHEAYLAGVPVLTADRGGMAELVEAGKTGLHFRLGDADDLRRQLLRVLREPGLLESLARQFPVVKSIEEDAAGIEEQYRLLLPSRAPTP